MNLYSKQTYFCMALPVFPDQPPLDIFVESNHLLDRKVDIKYSRGIVLLSIFPLTIWKIQTKLHRKSPTENLYLYPFTSTWLTVNNVFQVQTKRWLFTRMAVQDANKMDWFGTGLFSKISEIGRMFDRQMLVQYVQL